ncbi:unnamed protein product [Mytilus edulis]|nr:unnamed protein product [Mytilus edulis]
MLNIAADGTLKYKIRTNFKAFDLTFVNENTVAITSGETTLHTCIALIDLETRSQIKFIEILGRPFGITYDEDSLFVCVEKFGIYKLDTVDYDIRCVIRNYLPCVFCCNREGSPLWTFRDDLILKYPRGITVDNDGNVYVVGEKSSNVVIISTDETKGKSYRTNHMDSTDSNVDIEDLQRRFLKCPICFNLFNNNDRHPRVLPCLHSYCYVCLQQLIQESQYKCPLCKSDFYVNNINVDLFPKDNTRRDLLDFVRAGGDTSVIQCEECRNDSAISRCKDCHKFICRTCCTAHETMQTFHGHSVFGLDDFQLSMDQVPKFRHSLMCEKHPKYELNFFCDGPECQKPICLTCCLCFHTNRPENNQNHITREIEAVYHEKVEKMQNKKVKINKTEQELVVLSKNTNKQINKLAINIENISQEIEAIFGVAAEMLQRRKDALIATAEKLKTDKETLLMKQETEVKSSISTIRDACSFIDQTIASENQPAFILLSETISDRLATYKIHTMTNNHVTVT